MKNDNVPKVSTAEQRRLAEERLKESRKGTTAAATEVDPLRQLHELQVHQIELEMQNVELRQARDDREILLAQYTDLYDFAPVGYLTVDRKGTIRSVNLSAAGLLGIERSKVSGRQFEIFVNGAERTAFVDFFTKVFASQVNETCEVALRKAGNVPLFVRIDAVASAGGEECKLALTDITTVVQQAQIIREKQQQLEILNHTLENRIAAATSNLTEANRKLRLLYLQREKVREEERRQLAREVHDEIGQMLIAIKFDLARLNQDTRLSAESHQVVATVDEEISHVINRVQSVISELRPALLDDLGLCAAIKWLAESFIQRTGIACRVDLCSSPPRLSKEQENALFRIAKEGLSNVSRHAAATEVTIGSCSEQQRYTYYIADNGQGITEQQLSAHDSFGIMGMLEYAELIGAVVEVEPLPERGTIIRVHIPV